jgi:hypothetical protein
LAQFSPDCNDDLIGSTVAISTIDESEIDKAVRCEMDRRFLNCRMVKLIDGEHHQIDFASARSACIMRWSVDPSIRGVFIC